MSHLHHSLTPSILIVGGADTGRAPMAVVLLQRLLATEGLSWSISSAGVVGHVDAPAEAEARAAMAAMGLDLTEHRARLLSDELVATANLLIAVDTGIARVLQAHYPQAQIITLGELAGRKRDVPDPFRMQIGAWLQYANEIETLLRAGLARLHQLLEPAQANMMALPPLRSDEPLTAAHSDPVAMPSIPATEALPVSPDTSGALQCTPAIPVTDRAALVRRACQILDLQAELPAVLVWSAARSQLLADLAILAQPSAPGDLAQPYVSLVQAMFDLVASPPGPAQALALREALARLATPIDPEAISALSTTLGRISRV